MIKFYYHVQDNRKLNNDRHYTLSNYTVSNMKFVFFLGVCLVVVFVVKSFVEDESEGVFFEDEEEHESLHHLKKVI